MSEKENKIQDSSIKSKDEIIKSEERIEERRITKGHSKDIIGNPQEGVKIRKQFENIISHLFFTSKKELRKINEALKDPNWILFMQEELNQFKRNDIWYLTEKQSDKNIIGTKWVFKNKLDEHGTVVRNKAELVANGYAQIKGIDFEETFTQVPRLKSIMILLSMACHLKFKLFQMDVKNVFLNGIL